MLEALFGSAFGPVGMGVGFKHGLDKGGSNFDDKAAEKMGVSRADYELAVKHGTINRGTGSLLDDSDDEGDFDAMGSAGNYGSM